MEGLSAFKNRKYKMHNARSLLNEQIFFIYNKYYLCLNENLSAPASTIKILNQVGVNIYNQSILIRCKILKLIRSAFRMAFSDKRIRV